MRSRPRRRQSHGELTKRLHLESFLLQLSTAFIQVRADDAESLVDAWLGKLGEFIGVDRSTLWEMSANGETMYRRHFHSPPGSDPAPTTLPSRQYPWLAEQYRSGKVVAWSRVPRDIPEIAVAEREHALRLGVKSALSIPISLGSVLCVCVFVSVRRYRSWPPALIQRLRLAGEIFANSVARQRAEASLHSSEARNQAMLRAIPDLLFVLSPDGVYLDCHRRDDSELLMPPERFLGRPIEEILPPEVASAFRAASSRASQTGQLAELEYTLSIQGEPREYEARMVRRDDGSIVCFVRNVTERSRSARRLRESEERFRGAFDHSAIGIALVSPEGHWLQVNATTCRILGYSEAELLASKFQAITHADDLALNLHHLRRALAGEIDHYEVEKRYIHKDGRTIPALLTVSLVRDALCRPLYFVSQLQDLTERKRGQIEIERLRLELAHFGRLSLTGQLTASLAHQLIQPISAALGNAEACQRLIAAGPAEPQETLAILGDIVSSCLRAADVIHNVRSLLRKESGPRSRVNLNRLVEEVIAVTHSDLILRQVRLTTRLDPGLPEIDCNSIELQQVILNLLLNGAEALSEIAPSRRELVIATSRRDEGVQVTVSDCGTGVDPSDLNRMFEPFYTTKPEGMGMGLPISSGIVRAHGGRLWAELNSTGGMALHCVLPLPRSRAAETAREEGAAASA